MTEAVPKVTADHPFGGCPNCSPTLSNWDEHGDEVAA